MATPRTSPREMARALATGCSTVDELVARVAISDDRVKLMLKSMMDRGLVRSDGGGFVLTDAGNHARMTRL